MFDVLMQNGISPQGGWLLDAVVTKADLSRVVVQALRKEDQVENPNDPQSWIDVLKAQGISLDRLSETIQSVEVHAGRDGAGCDAAIHRSADLRREFRAGRQHPVHGGPESGDPGVHRSANDQRRVPSHRPRRSEATRNRKVSNHIRKTGMKQIRNFIVAGLLFALAAPALAADAASPIHMNNRLRLGYDDNVYQVDDPVRQRSGEADSFRIIEEIEMLVSMNLERTYLGLRYRPSLVWYSDRNDDDTDLLHDLDVNFVHNFSRCCRCR
jgi:hypothetical protein